MIYFVIDINANEATENPAEDRDGDIIEDITREKVQEQKLDLELNKTQSKTKGNTAWICNHFTPLSLVAELSPII